MNARIVKFMLVAGVSAVVLSGCGGGGDDTVDTTVPAATASQSESGLVTYVASVANTAEGAEPAEPVILDDFTSPTSSEDGSPVATSADDV